MSKKIINIDEMVMGWEQVYPMLYYAVLNNYAERMQEGVEFIVDGEPFDITILLKNLKMLIDDSRWKWPPDRTPFDVLKLIPSDTGWCGLVDMGPHWKAKKELGAVLTDNNFQAKVHHLKLAPAMQDFGMGGRYVNEMQPHSVLAFESDEDYIYWKLKHS